MGKSLFIVRHAQAEWVNHTSDKDRPLSIRGLRDAEIIGNLFSTYHETPDIWMSSPAKRTWQTAKIFAKSLQIESKNIQTIDHLYLGSVPTYLHVINQLDDPFESAIIFGHNPTVSELTSYLCNTRYVDFEPSTLVEIDFPYAESWAEISIGTGNPKRFLYPQHEYFQ